MADRSGYIGRAPGDSSVTVARQTFSPTGITTDFTFVSGYTVGYLDLFLNGAKLIEGVDYNATDTSTISLVSAAINGDVLEGVAYKAFNLGDKRIGIQSGGALIGNVDTLNFVGTGNTFALNGGTIDVSISGGAGAGGTWSNYDGVLGVTTTKKVKIQNNLEVTGVTTSTGGFVGNVTGNATGITGTPDITVRNITGVAATFTGVLTYEDVTNVDSIGVVTARSGVHFGTVASGTLVVGDSDGIGIGTGNPTEKLHVFDRTGSGGVIHYDGASNAHFGLRIRSNSDGGNFESDFANGTTSMLDLFADAGTVSGGDFLVCRSQTSTPILLVKGNGRVGIGSAVPQQLLDIASTAPNIRFTDTVDGHSEIDGNAASLKFNADKGNEKADTTITFHIDNTERLRIASAGQIGLGGANYGTSGQVILSNGSGSAPTWGDVPAAGLTTEALVSSGIVTTLNLTAAQDHKVTASGITTITVSGGTEADSHTVRIINSGITTVGFSTFFLFPSGSTPSLPTADGAISLISFTVNRVGTAGTQLLAGASVNYS